MTENISRYYSYPKTRVWGESRRSSSILTKDIAAASSGGSREVSTPLPSTFTRPQSGKWYRGVVDAADRFMTRWHKAEKCWLRHATENAKSVDKGKPGGQPYWYSCRRKRRRHGRSCGKVPVRLISGTCATIALNPRVSGSFCLFSLSSMGGARKR